MEQDKYYEEGGINGLGKGIVNTNSHEFQVLKQTIFAEYNKQTPTEILENELLSLRFRLEIYVAEDNKEVIEVCHTLNKLRA